jgi:hypothetical protein
MAKHSCNVIGCEKRAVCSLGPDSWWCADHYDGYTSARPCGLVVAPGIPASEVVALRAHIDEAVSDPDYSVVVSYEARWDEN